MFDSKLYKIDLFYFLIVFIYLYLSFYFSEESENKLIRVKLYKRVCLCCDYIHFLICIDDRVLKRQLIQLIFKNQ